MEKEKIQYGGEKIPDKKYKCICTHCKNDEFKVYIKIIIDDARLFCTKCGKEFF